MRAIFSKILAPSVIHHALSGKWRQLFLVAALLFPLSITTPLSATTYFRGEAGEPASLDPHKTSTVIESDILLDLNEGLVTYDSKANIVPGMASSFEISPDGLTYTFHLRDAKWSNGDPVTAGDFVYSLRRLMDPATSAQYANILYTLKNAEKINKGELKPEELGAQAKDDKTLILTLENPTPYFIAQLAHQTALPVHKASIDVFGKDFAKPGNLVSNGAYILKEFVPNDHLTLVKNPNYYGAKSVTIDTEIIYPIEDRSAALRRFQAGEIMLYNDVPTDQIKFIRDNLKGQFHSAPYLGTYYFAVNTKKPPFDDVRIRQALSMIIDREFLAEKIWGGTMIPGYSFVPPGIANYGTPAMMPWKDYSPIEREDKAIALMKAAGYGPGGKTLNVEIRYNTSENHKNTSIALADMWKPLNVNATFINTDIKTHYALLQSKGDYDIARAGWIGDYSDPQNFLFLGESTNPKLNYPNYSNPQYDNFLKQAAQTSDLTKRAALLFQAETLLVNDEPYIPLLYYASKNLVSPKLQGFEDNTLDIHLTRFLSVAP